MNIRLLAHNLSNVIASLACLVMLRFGLRLNGFITLLLTKFHAFFVLFDVLGFHVKLIILIRDFIHHATFTHAPGQQPSITHHHNIRCQSSSSSFPTEEHVNTQTHNNTHTTQLFIFFG